MSVIFDTTIGGVSSNAYPTLEYVEQYMENRPYATLWDALTIDDDKKKYIIYATTFVDAYTIPYGTQTASTQSLLFPREDGTDCRGNDFVDDEIPVGILNGVCEQVLHLLRTNVSEKDSILTKGFKSGIVGKLEVVVDGMFVEDAISSLALEFISCYGDLKNSSQANGVCISEVYRN
jgi:hypothetical protein